MDQHKSDVTDVLQILGKEDAKFRVLAWFFRNPQQAVYPARLANILSLPEPSVRRSLHTLARRRIINDHPTRYRHYFRFKNRRSPR